MTRVDVTNMIGRISTYCLITLVLVFGSIKLESDYLSQFLFENIVIILITLLAINTATYGFLISRLDDVTKDKTVFNDAIDEIKKSLLIQFILIGIAIVVSVLESSSVLKPMISYHREVFDFCIVFVFVFSIDLLRDTGFSIFELRKLS